MVVRMASLGKAPPLTPRRPVLVRQYRHGQQQPEVYSNQCRDDRRDCPSHALTRRLISSDKVLERYSCAPPNAYQHQQWYAHADQKCHIASLFPAMPDYHDATPASLAAVARLDKRLPSAHKIVDSVYAQHTLHWYNLARPLGRRHHNGPTEFTICMMIQALSRGRHHRRTSGAAQDRRQALVSPPANPHC